MTDEAMAEEWAKEHEGEYISDLMNLKEAFLAGLKAGEQRAKKEIEEELLKCYSGYPQEVEE